RQPDLCHSGLLCPGQLPRLPHLAGGREGVCGRGGRGERAIPGNGGGVLMRRPLIALLLLGAVLAPARAEAQGDSVRINFECPSCAGKARVGIAFMEDVGLQIGVNLINQFIIKGSSEDATPETWARNLREGWEFDDN